MAFEIIKKGENEFELTGLDTESGNCWLAVGKASVCLHKSDEGLVIDIYRLGHEDSESISSTYVFDAELEEDEQCPNCKNGTLEVNEAGEVVCRGECGAVIRKAKVGDG